jgi:predicted O-methyltransferase YrrM
VRGGQFLHWIKYHLGFDPAATQTTDAERAALSSHARGCRSLVEIGVFEGVTSLVLRKTMDPAGTLACVDPFFKGALGISYGLSISKREIAKSPNGSVRFVRFLSHEAAGDWSAPVDFIFIDGDHSDEGVGRDWRDWSPHIVPGGFAAFHDSVAPEGTPGPPALVRKIQSSQPDFRLVCQVDSLTIFQRRAGDKL